MKEELSQRGDLEYSARALLEIMALILQASLLLRAADPCVADVFCRSRLQPTPHRLYGTLPQGINCRHLIDRAWSPLDR